MSSSYLNREFSWSVIIALGWLWLIGPGDIEGYFFPAATPMVLEHAVSTNAEQAMERHLNFKSVSHQNGRYTAIWLQSARLRHPHCKPEKLSWRLGKRSGNNVPVEWHWGPPEVKGDGVFHAGPWIIKVPNNELNNTFADVYHQCSWFGIELPWLTKSRFWN